MVIVKQVAVPPDSDAAPQQIYRIDKLEHTHLMPIQIPMTAGTGLEINNIAIVTTGGRTKTNVVAPQR